MTRLIASVPAVLVLAYKGEEGSGPLLVLSQVILSLQLPFAIFPLIQFTSNPKIMGPLVTPMWMKALAWPVSVIIAALNVYLLYQTALAFFGG
jgi:manganese transport protein